MKLKTVFFSFVILFLLMLLTSFLFPTQLPGLYNMFEPLGSKVGTLSITGQAPQVMAIYMDDGVEEKELTDDPYDMAVDGIACNNKSITFKAWIYDINGDCSDFDTDPDASITVYLCAPPNSGPYIGGPIPVCDENNKDYEIDLDVVDVVWGGPGSNQNCNFTSSTVPNWEVPYYDRWENWTVNVTVIDTDAIGDDLKKTWFYNVLGAFIYPPAGDCSERPDMNLGSVTPGAWNDGTGCGVADMESGCYIKNTGNIRLNMTWNATNFTHTTDSTQFIGMEGDNFAVDDDNQRGEGVETRDTHVFMEAWPEPFVPREFYPDYGTADAGLRRCDNTACERDEQGNTGANNKANYSVYWHVNVPSGLISGQYNNSIEITSDDYEGSW
jgi:hypothetical protein